jgi:hypothetical protein
MSSDARSTDRKRGDDLGRLTAVMGSIRATFERRQRLRQCLIQAGAENLPDYELLQVMLFTSNPHADVESLVGELLDRFDSLAEVMSADTEALAAAGLSLPAIAGVKFVREVALRFLRADCISGPWSGRGTNGSTIAMRKSHTARSRSFMYSSSIERTHS